LAILILFCCAVVSAAAQQREFCVVCGKGPLVGTIWKHPHGTICRDCVKLDAKCDICGLPVLKNYLKTRDGRFICQFEKDEVVVNEREAQVLFKSAMQSVVYLSGDIMRLRGPAPDVKLFDIDYWNSGSGSNMRRGGFSQSRIVGSRITHNVILLSGLPRDELISVSAHEYTHLWINENKKPERMIEPDTLEAICELVAYKVCERAGFTNQLEKIRRNPYTNGRILTLLQADRQYGLARVLEWVRNGTGSTLNVTSRHSSPPRAAAPPSTARPSRPSGSPGGNATAAPASGLKLTSISRTSRGLRAEINGVLFYQGQLKRIRYNGRPANLHCLRIGGSSVTVSVNRGNPMVIRLGR